MSLHITAGDSEGIAILDLKGQLTLGQEDLDFRGELDRLIGAGSLRVALNLGDLHKLDTTGLGTLLSARSKLQQLGGNLVIFDMQPVHLAFLAEARLETVLDLYRDKQDAIDSFFPGRQLRPFDILEFVESQRSEKEGKAAPRS
jgi:anti-sigma B factor antagonist